MFSSGVNNSSPCRCFFTVNTLHLPFNSPTDDLRTLTVVPDEKRLNISVMNILVMNPLYASRCASMGFVLQGKSQVLVSGETSSVASISEPLPLCSLSALSASFSLPCALTWSGRHWAACQMKRRSSSSSSPECSSLLCVRG